MTEGIGVTLFGVVGLGFFVGDLDIGEIGEIDCHFADGVVQFCAVEFAFGLNLSKLYLGRMLDVLVLDEHLGNLTFLKNEHLADLPVLLKFRLYNLVRDIQNHCIVDADKQYLRRPFHLLCVLLVRSHHAVHGLAFVRDFKYYFSLGELISDGEGLLFFICLCLLF